MSRRKSPYKHDVKTHTRQGKTIDSYKRGKGNKQKDRKPRDKRIRKRRVVGRVPVFKGYTVKVIYPDGKTQTIRSHSTTMASAIDDGLSRRRAVRDVKSVRIRGIK